MQRHYRASPAIFLPSAYLIRFLLDRSKKHFAYLIVAGLLWGSPLIRAFEGYQFNYTFAEDKPISADRIKDIIGP